MSDEEWGSRRVKISWVVDFRTYISLLIFYISYNNRVRSDSLSWPQYLAMACSVYSAGSWASLVQTSSKTVSSKGSSSQVSSTKISS